MSAAVPTTPPGSPGATHGAAGQPLGILALAALGKHNHVRHESNLFVTVETLQVPWVSAAAASDFLDLPANRVVELGAKVRI